MFTKHLQCAGLQIGSICYKLFEVYSSCSHIRQPLAQFQVQFSSDCHISSTFPALFNKTAALPGYDGAKIKEDSPQQRKHYDLA